MLAQLRRALILSGFVLLVASGAWAQTTTLEGDVKDQNGQPLPKAVIVLNRTDIKGHYQVKTDKKGHWLYTGLPFGIYDISCEVDGKVMDKVSGVHSKYGEVVPVNFDLSKIKQQQAATAQANANGELTPEQERGMTKEQKAQYEAQLKQRTEAMKKNKALNDAYNGGQDAIKAAGAETDKEKKAADYRTAIDSLTKATELADTDANKAAVWDSLGEAYAGLAATQTGDDRTKAYDQAIDAYNKGLTFKPNDAAIYNQLGNIYGAERKIPEATEALTKSAQLDPGMAGKAYYNMGANLVNSGQTDKASEFFKKATEADPSYADAWFQYGSSLMAKGSVDAKTGQQIYPPDTGPALQKYLDLQPNGSHAQEASAMLQAMGEKVQVKTTNPNATKKKPPL
jgi:tetratricopeptide (TPR) repeat protein